MGWFSPIKGGYPGLSQIDKTLPVDASATGITRGTIIEMTSDTVSADGVFKIAADASNEGLLYIALQDYEDAQAGMAGTTGFDAGMVPADFPIEKGMAATPGVPTITGLSLSMEGEYETDNFDSSLEGAPVGSHLGVSNGVFTLANEGADFVAYLTAAPYSRWINNLNVKPEGATRFNAVRQGGTKNVIRFRTK